VIEAAIPGRGVLRIRHLVLDYNGTLACDGRIFAGVKELLNVLAEQAEVHVLTADTFGEAQSELEGAPCRLSVLPADNQDAAKAEYVKRLGADGTACVGNGRNDQLMLEAAALGIAVIQEEGAAADAVLSADVVCKDIVSALELLRNSLRLVATLRS